MCACRSHNLVLLVDCVGVACHTVVFHGQAFSWCNRANILSGAGPTEFEMILHGGTFELRQKEKSI